MVVPGDKQKCVEFFYHMLGEETGTLQVYVKDSKNVEHLLWQKHGPQGNKWKHGFIFIKKTGAYRIMFVSKGTKGARKEIAIDDVTIGPCRWFCKYFKSMPL